MNNKIYFKGKKTIEVITHARQQGSDVLLVKDEGVYLMAASHAKGKRLLAYAEGLDPTTRDSRDVFDEACRLCGGDDFMERLPSDDPTFDHLLEKQGYLEFLITQTEFCMTSVG
ncbi:DUF3085 domain-containing protein [Serratia marcescens]|uniref:DUF3085 domain-containing protein n=1 Tax=Serratia TaxID=613 RepID=UPI0010090917|nr:MULTISPECIES: DUF3085 domain-containing protein [Serratia]MBN5232549.1 DUF3085 domain-containing protein [Serratia marcescens]MDX6804275.1 DUF3085 domain-containing protein [Serratia marcescens]MDX6909077.1 DUF3085 domain-containing protein [Serratia marcescens]RXG74088.1 DUF3085 domain-containing protein [Serratia marcescens]RXG74301.1 DUF3085 domain-containing protein [Serratia marcescens]